MGEEFDADIHTPYSSHMVTPIWIAAQEGHVAMVSYLVQRGADVNNTSLRGATPLHISLLLVSNRYSGSSSRLGRKQKLITGLTSKRILLGFQGSRRGSTTL